MMRTVAAFIFLVVWVVPAAADDYVSLNEKGNEAFARREFNDALDYYRQAEVERPETPEIYYNEANALVETGSYEEAVEKYEKALNVDDIQLQASTYYNGGNSFFKQEDYRQAIEWYQRALELSPDDMDIKYNLELARNRLREQLERQPQDQQQQQQQEQENQNQDEQQQQEQQQQQEDQQQQPEPPPQQQPPDPDEMSEEDAKRILNALEDTEKENQKKQKKFEAQGVYRGKDW